QVTWTNSRGGSGTATGTAGRRARGMALLHATDVPTVSAQDAAGNTATATLTVTLTDATPPSVALTAPAAGATVAGSAVILSAAEIGSAAWRGGQFKRDGANLGAETTTARYAVPWKNTK